MGEIEKRRDDYVTNAAIDLMARIAKAYAMSGMFDDTNGELAAFVKISAGREMGIQPFASMSGISIIGGKPVVGAGLLASLVKSHPSYDYRVLTHTEEECAIAYFQDGVEIGVSRFTMDDAKRAGLTGKKVWQQYPRNLLFARAMSNGAAFYTPDVTGGRAYVEGEIEESPSQRRKQDAAKHSTIPAATEPRETIVDVEPEPDDGTPTPGEAERAIALAIEQEEARRAAAEASKTPAQVAHEAQQASYPVEIPLTDDPNGPTHTFDPSVDPLLSVETATRLNERSTEAPDDDLPFGDPDLVADQQYRPLSDAQKIDAIGDMFRPASGVALPAAERAKVKKACQALGIWGEQTPRELFRMFGDEAMTLATLKDALAAALEALPKESPAPAAAEPQEPVHAPPSAAEMLRKQEARVAEVVAVLGALSQDQAAVVYAAVPEGLQTPTDIARDLWLSYGLAALGADSLVDAVKAGS